jgi:hypothetical protein
MYFNYDELNSIVKLPNNNKNNKNNKIYLMTIINKGIYDDSIKIIEDLIDIDNLFDICTKYSSWKIKYCEHNLNLHIKITTIDIDNITEWNKYFSFFNNDYELNNMIKFFYKTADNFEPNIKLNLQDNSYYLLRGLITTYDFIKYIEDNNIIHKFNSYNDLNKNIEYENKEYDSY